MKRMDWDRMTLTGTQWLKMGELELQWNEMKWKSVRTEWIELGWNGMSWNVKRWDG